MRCIQKFQQMSSEKWFDRLKWKLFYLFSCCLCYQQLQGVTIKCDTKTAYHRITEGFEKGFAPGFSLCRNLGILVSQMSRFPRQPGHGRVVVGVLRALTGSR